jgi:hypothetical protein
VVYAAAKLLLMPGSLPCLRGQQEETVFTLLYSQLHLHVLLAQPLYPTVLAASPCLASDCLLRRLSLLVKDKARTMTLGLTYYGQCQSTVGL